METISESSGNVFADLGFSAKESALLAMRAELMARLRETITERGWTQTEAASQLGIGQSRVSDLVRGKWNSAAFLHWGANQVYCQDADVSHVRDEFYRVVTTLAESEGRLAATLRANSQLARESADLRALSTALAAKVPSGPAASVPVASPSPPSRPSAPVTASPVRASPTRARPAAAEKVAATATVNPAPPPPTPARPTKLLLGLLK